MAATTKKEIVGRLRALIQGADQRLDALRTVESSTSSSTATFVLRTATSNNNKADDEDDEDDQQQEEVRLAPNKKSGILPVSSSTPSESQESLPSSHESPSDDEYIASMLAHYEQHPGQREKLVRLERQYSMEHFVNDKLRPGKGFSPSSSLGRFAPREEDLSRHRFEGEGNGPRQSSSRKSENDRSSRNFNHHAAKNESVVRELEDKLSSAQELNTSLQRNLALLSEENTMRITQLNASHQQALRDLRLKYEGLMLEKENSNLHLLKSMLHPTSRRINEVEYKSICAHSEASLSLEHLIQKRVYELLLDKQQDKALLAARLATSSHDLNTAQTKAIEAINQANVFERHAQTLQNTILTLQAENGLLKRGSKVKFNVIEGEGADRRHLEHVQTEGTLKAQLETAHTYMLELEARLERANKEKEEVSASYGTVFANHELLVKDKHYLQTQNDDLRSQISRLETQNKILQDNLVAIKHEREDLYSRLLQTQQKESSAIEEKVHREIERMKEANAVEMELIQTSSKNLHERELRVVQSELSRAQEARAHLEFGLKEANARHEAANAQVLSLKLELDAKLSEAHAEIKIKSFENDRLRMLVDEAKLSETAVSLENEKCRQKIELLTKEYYTLEQKSSLRISELEAKGHDLEGKMAVYVSLEQELDEAVYRAAESNKPEEILFGYNFGGNVPTTAKRRLRQCVSLARKLIAMERKNTQLNEELLKREESLRALRSESDVCKDLLAQTSQPYSYLIASVKERDEEIALLRDRLKGLEQELVMERAEKKRLEANHALLSADVERLLAHEQDFRLIKQALIQMKGGAGSSALPLSFDRLVARGPNHAPSPLPSAQLRDSRRDQAPGSNWLQGNTSSVSPGPIVINTASK